MTMNFKKVCDYLDELTPKEIELLLVKLNSVVNASINIEPQPICSGGNKVHDSNGSMCYLCWNKKQMTKLN